MMQRTMHNVEKPGRENIKRMAGGENIKRMADGEGGAPVMIALDQKHSKEMLFTLVHGLAVFSSYCPSLLQVFAVHNSI